MNALTSEATALHSEVGRDEYDAYLRLLRRAFTLLGGYYAEGASAEFHSMDIYAKKFINTIKALRLKHGHSLWRGRPSVDTAASGFPSFYDVSQLSVDLTARDLRLENLLKREDLKPQILDLLMAVAESEDAEKANAARLAELLWLYAERAYYELLDIRRLFFSFTPGKVIEAGSIPSVAGRKSYYVSWACYDSQSNLPYIYLMLFEHKADSGKDLGGDAGKAEIAHLLEALQQVGGRAPIQLQAIGVRLDEILPNIYPRVIRRHRIGPIFAPLLYRGPMAETSLARQFAPYFAEAGLSDEDFILFGEIETVVSDREEMPKSLLSSLIGQGKARQIFRVPKNDRELLRRGSTSFSRYTLMPHRLRQHLTDQDIALSPELFGRVEFLTYITGQEGVQRVG